MTTTVHTTAPADVDPCPACHGAGELTTPTVDPETGFYGSQPCAWCNGHGTVPAGTCTTCQACAVPMFIDEQACSHSGDVLCDTCALERCAECRDDAAGDHSCDVWLDIIRGGAR